MTSWSTPYPPVQEEQLTGNARPFIPAQPYGVQMFPRAQIGIPAHVPHHPVELGGHATFSSAASRLSPVERAQQAYEHFLGFMTRLDLASGLRQLESRNDVKAAFDDFHSIYFDNLEMAVERYPTDKVLSSPPPLPTVL
jgi:hypothetical protein